MPERVVKKGPRWLSTRALSFVSARRNWMIRRSSSEQQPDSSRIAMSWLRLGLSKAFSRSVWRRTNLSPYLSAIERTNCRVQRSSPLLRRGRYACWERGRYRRTRGRMRFWTMSVQECNWSRVPNQRLLWGRLIYGYEDSFFPFRDGHVFIEDTIKEVC